MDGRSGIYKDDQSVSGLIVSNTLCDPNRTFAETDNVFLSLLVSGQRKYRTRSW